MLSESKLKFYSLGIVVETKADDTDVVKVIPIEEYSFVDGKIIDHKEEFNSDYTDMAGVIKKTSAESTVYLEAKWFPFAHSNRLTSPDVVVNETLLIFKYADSPDYYWITIYREPKLRRLERVLYGFSNLATGIAKKAFDKFSSYWFEVSTKDKHIWLKTTKSDGEAFEYDVKIDTRAGYVEVKDDLGNHYTLDSSSSTITVNALATVNIKAPNINLEASSQITMTSPKILNNAGLVENTGDELTAGTSKASPHVCCVLPC